MTAGSLEERRAALVERVHSEITACWRPAACAHDEESQCAEAIVSLLESGEAGVVLVNATAGRGDEIRRLRWAYSATARRVMQTLGRALTGAPESGPDVCVGDHIPESIAAEAAERIRALTVENARLRAEIDAHLKVCQGVGQ